MSKIATILITFATLLNLSIFVIRMGSVLEQGLLTTTTGIEGPMMYGIWKVSHGYPLYEGPSEPVLSSTLYNYLFYRTYAALCTVLSSWPQFLLACRLITPVFSALGAGIGIAAVALLGNLTSKQRFAWALCAILLFWFGTSPVGWFGISARPDIAGVCCVEVGLALFLWCLKGGRRIFLLLSSLAFFLSWSFKQSLVLTFIGVLVIHIVFIRRWKDLLLQAGPFMVCAMVVLYRGGPDYRFNVLIVPSLGVFYPKAGWLLAAKATIENPVLYGLAPLSMLILLSLKSTPKQLWRTQVIERDNWQVVVLGTLFLVVFVGSIVFCLRAGSDRNYFFEAGMIGGIAALSSLLYVYQQVPRFASLITISLASAVCLVSLAQLAALNSPFVSKVSSIRLLSLSGKTEFGRLRLLSGVQQEERTSLRAILANSKKPVLITDQIFSQPIFSTDDSFPAFVEDPNLAADLLAHHLIKTDPVVSAIRIRHFRTLMLADSAEEAAAISAGYTFSGRAGNSFQIYRLSDDADKLRKLKLNANVYAK